MLVDCGALTYLIALKLYEASDIVATACRINEEGIGAAKAKHELRHTLLVKLVCEWFCKPGMYSVRLCYFEDGSHIVGVIMRSQLPTRVLKVVLHAVFHIKLVSGCIAMYLHHHFNQHNRTDTGHSGSPSPPSAVLPWLGPPVWYEHVSAAIGGCVCCERGNCVLLHRTRRRLWT